MSENTRLYNCKDEELPIIGKLVASSIESDLPTFTTYSPGFDDGYVTDLKQKVTTVADLIAPEEETVARKVITGRIYATLNNLTEPAGRLEGYITLAHDTLKVSPSDFGIGKLRQGIKNHDVEEVTDALHLINNQIVRYKETLQQKGLTEELIAAFTGSYTSLTTDKTEQYGILNNRKAIVQNNIATLNDLHQQITEVMKIGKILFKNDSAKVQQYTFSNVLKNVHYTVNAKTDNNSTPADNADKKA